jgi:hypothetical protein
LRVLGDDPAPLIPVRVDGKTVRGAKNPDGSQVHLLAALAGQPGAVAAQAEAGPSPFSRSPHDLETAVPIDGVLL